MSIYKSISRAVAIAAFAAVVITSTRLQADTGTCGGRMFTLPFNDAASSPFFRQIAEATLKR